MEGFLYNYDYNYITILYFNIIYLSQAHYLTYQIIRTYFIQMHTQIGEKFYVKFSVI